MEYQYLFGPVPSRRLGISLGIDLVPLKTCTFNCIYCECGKTTNLTLERNEYTPTEKVIEELDTCLASHPQLDYVTFSGSGEPTLHTGIGTIARHIKERYPDYHIALLTNGSLFWDPAVRTDVRDMDVIIPSLDAVTPSIFHRIDRPHGALSPQNIIQGLKALREEFSGEIWLEIFIIPGLNDSVEELARLKDAIYLIRPDRVQLNTLDRPGIVDWITVPHVERMDWIARTLDYPHVEVIGSPISRTEIACFSQDVLELIVSTIKRRPCTLPDLSQMCGMHPGEIKKYIEVLTERKLIMEKKGRRGIFYIYQE